MSYIQSFILGIIQGLTEFLPISSSAHLVLVPYLFNWTISEEQVFPFDVLVQLGTLVAVILYFWKDLVDILKGFLRGLVNKEPFKEIETRMGWYLILATIPAGILGMSVKSQVEAAFSSPTVTALFLFGTAGLLLLADLVGKRTRTIEEMTWLDALWMGLFQAISIFPGISRSGATITGGMTRNLDRSSSARFSFLMSVPVMLGASLVSIKDLFEVPDLSSFLPILLVGFLTAAITGYLSIHWLLSYIKKRKFHVFSIYCAVLATAILLIGALNSDKVTAAAPSTETPSAVSTSAPEIGPTLQSVSGFQIVNVSLSSSTAWIIPTMSGCAGTLGDFGLVTNVVPTASLSDANPNLVIRWGAPDDLITPSYQIGTDSLVLVVNTANPLVKMKASIAQRVFSGKYETWGDLREACPDCFDKNYDGSLDGSSIALGFYDGSEDIQTVFNRLVMNGQPAASAGAALIPDPQAMVEFLQGDRAAIGYINAGAMEEGLKEVILTDIDSAALEQPLLAISQSTPEGASRELLICVQKVLNP